MPPDADAASRRFSRRRHVTPRHFRFDAIDIADFALKIDSLPLSPILSPLRLAAADIADAIAAEPD